MSDSKERVIIGKDRCDYRCMTDQELVEEAKYNPNPELAIALGERLWVNNREHSCPNCGH